MSRNRSRLAILFPAVLLAVALIAPALQAQEKKADPLELMKKFDSAVKLYTRGEYEQAIKLLDEVIKANPSSHDALMLREQAGMGILVKMLRDPKVRDVATMILRRAAEESSKLQRDPETIKQLIDQTGNEEYVTRETAVRKLIAIGPFGVPFLLDQALSDDPFSLTSRRVAALRIIREMASAGIPPLLVAFENAKPEAAARIARLLGESPDARSVPPLMAAMENEKTPDFVRQAASMALDILRAPVTPAEAKKPAAPQMTAAQACLELATRYYYNDVALIESIPTWQRVNWKWNPQGKLYAECLTFEDVPRYAYPRLRADALLLQGMKLPHQQPEFLELYLCNNYMQIEEASAANDTARAAALAPLGRINESLGVSYFYRALGRALQDGTTPLAHDCILALRSIGDPRPPTGQNALVQALTCPEKSVRANAAETLMFLSPSGEVGATEEVIGTVAGALGATVRPRVLVLTNSDALYKTLSSQISSWAMVPERRNEQVELMERIRSMAPPVSLVMLDTRLKGMTGLGIAKLLRTELGESMPPVILLAPADDVAKLRTDAAGLPVGALPIPPPSEELRKMSFAAVASSKAPVTEDILQDTAMVKKVLTTLSRVPRSSKYPTVALAGTLARLCTGYPQEIRILAMQAIAALPTAEPRDAMFAILANAKEPVEVRRAAGAAFLNALVYAPALDPTQRADVRKVTADADAQVAAVAAHALAIADIAQTEREARLLEIGAKAK